MNALLKSTLFVGAMVMASPLVAKPMTLDVTMKNYYGAPAYVVVYILDANDKYVSTVYLGGSYQRFFQEYMTRWYRMLKRSRRGIDGLTGASVGAGRSFTANFNVPDKLLNKGYTLRVATAVEGQYYIDKDAEVILNDANNGKKVAGTKYVDQMQLNF